MLRKNIVFFIKNTCIYKLKAFTLHRIFNQKKNNQMKRTGANLSHLSANRQAHEHNYPGEFRSVNKIKIINA